MQTFFAVIFQHSLIGFSTGPGRGRSDVDMLATLTDNCR